MNSILNSISQGDLQVIPGDTPIINKENSIVDLLQNPEIEFNSCPPEEPKEEVYIEFQELPKEEPIKEDSIQDLLINSEIELNMCPHPENPIIDFNTGFGGNQDLHYEIPCKKPILKAPLYKENYLNEFESEEDKALARRALGLYNKEDIVAMSLLTAVDEVPNDWEEATIKQLRKGDKFFTPYTSFKAVFDSDKISLDVHINKIKELLTSQQQELQNIVNITEGQNISSLGDIKQFLQGFTKKQTLNTVITTINEQMLRFNKTGQIT